MDLWNFKIHCKYIELLIKSLLATTVVFTLENYLNLVSKSQKLTGTNVLQNGLLTNGLHNQSNYRSTYRKLKERNLWAIQQ